MKGHTSSKKRNKICLVNLKSDDSSDLCVVSTPDTMHKFLKAGLGEENIEERPSDVYSNFKNVSVRAPRIIVGLAERGVTQSRAQNSFNNYMSISENEPVLNKRSFVSTNDLSSFIETRSFNRIKLNKSEVGSRNYHTDHTSKHVELFEPQTTYQTLRESEFSMSFGPKAR